MRVRIPPLHLKLNIMKIDKLITENIEWDIELCKSTANITVDNGKIISQEVSIYKDCPEPEGSIGNRFSSNDPQFIRDVHKALGEYIQHMDGIMRGVTYKEITPESYDGPSKGNVGTHADVQPQDNDKLPELD